MDTNDRTYFLNTETGSQFTENGLSPIDIKALNKELLVLSYGYKDEYGSLHIMEYSLFNVEQGTIQKRFDKYIFHNSEIAVFSDTPNDKGVCIYVIWYNDNAEEMVIPCKSYTIVEDVIYCCIVENEKYQIVKINSHKTKEEIPFCSGPQNEFVDFALEHYFIHRSGKYYYLKDIISPSNYIGISIRGKGALREINGIKVTDSNLVEDFYTLVESNKGICSDLELTADLSDVIIYDCKDGVYGKIVNYNYPYWDYNYKRPTVSSGLKRMNGSGNIDIDRWDDVYPSDNFIIVNRNDNIKIIQEGEIVREISNVKLKTTPGNKYLYIKEKNEITSVYLLGLTSDKLVAQGVLNELHLEYVQKYGIIGENSRSYRIYYIDSDRWEIMPHKNYIIEEKCGRCFLRDTDDAGQCYLLNEHHSPIALPTILSSILSITSNGSMIISNSPRGIIIYEKYAEDAPYDINEKLIDIIDTSEYRNALFSDDGNHTIYYKNNTWYYYDIINRSEVKFDMDKNVIKRQRQGLYNLNFLFRFQIDTDRRIDLVDPITLQTIAPGYLSEYVFISPSGKLASNTKVDEVRDKFFLLECNKKTKETVRSVEVTNILTEVEKRIASVKIEHLEFAFPGSTQKEWEKEIIEQLIKRLGWGKSKDNFYCLVAKRHAVVNVFSVNNNKVVCQIELPCNLGYLNSIVFSSDDKFVSICGKTILGGNLKDGFIGVYDMDRLGWSYGPITPHLAIWKSFFSMNGSFAYYNSAPQAVLGTDKKWDAEEILGRSVLTFSRSGKYIAMSDKGYVPFSINPSNWGHMKSANIYVRRVGCDAELSFSDHGDEISGLYEKNVTCVSFSPDDKKLMSVSQDGVIIIRNLHLDELQNSYESKGIQVNIVNIGTKKQQTVYDLRHKHK